MGYGPTIAPVVFPRSSPLSGMHCADPEPAHPPERLLLSHPNPLPTLPPPPIPCHPMFRASAPAPHNPAHRVGQVEEHGQEGEAQHGVRPACRQRAVGLHCHGDKQVLGHLLQAVHQRQRGAGRHAARRQPGQAQQAVPELRRHALHLPSVVNQEGHAAPAVAVQRAGKAGHRVEHVPTQPQRRPPGLKWEPAHMVFVVGWCGGGNHRRSGNEAYSWAILFLLHPSERRVAGCDQHMDLSLAKTPPNAQPHRLTLRRR
jgi:hypothetical protein